jgi:23S rRNA pseudouridine2604 synthase
MELMRLNKFLVDQGVCSRRAADRAITEGRVTVNGTKPELGVKVDGSETISFDGVIVGQNRSKRLYLAYHKPVGIICTSDPLAKDNIIETINYPERIFHIGRLDVASSGLILLTNDGAIVNKILRAEGKNQKEYIVRIQEDVTDDFITALRDGVLIDGYKTLPCKAVKMGPNMFAITLVEGRNRQIRKMCEALHRTVTSLKRIRVMNIKLDDIPPGKWRLLTPEEESTLLTTLNHTPA